MKQSLFDTTISALAAETSAATARRFDISARRSDIGAQHGISALAWSFQGYRSGVSACIGDCGVGMTLPMCNRVTNHGDMGTFSKPVWNHIMNINEVKHDKCD